ncbi:thrombospondin type 1 domain protein [Onchocerca flexuosa]|uniref:Thrombospondin type 1 domain protein n=2 Tax=Onchocerca flexuosa TaxID=387005 RepID=A0A238BTY8_9BILA|nr:thrombospondin type 1 domain protein [Onchocerca flexuosa]
MFIGVSDWLLYIVVTQIPIIRSGCYQKQLCCLGGNFTCIAVDDGIGHLPTKLRQQRLKKGRRGRWHTVDRKMKRIGKLVKQDFLADNGLEVASNHGYDSSGDYLNNQGEQTDSIKLSNNIEISPFVRYQLIFGQPSYSEEQQPETIRYYKRHKLIRYSLLNQHIPITLKDSRDIEGSNDASKLTFLRNTLHDNLCYCDEKCLTFGDCCSDYSFVCPPSDCAVSEWSAWSSCIPDQGDCGTGIQTRKRTIDRKPEHGGMKCPSLVEKMSCFNECPQQKRQHQSETTPVALILDYSYNKTRENFSHGNIHKKVVGKRSQLLYYCGIYELGWVNSNCIDKKISTKLYTGNNICVECQPEAQLHRNTATCTSDLSDGENGFWKLIGPKSCNGIWKRLYRIDNCRCETDFPRRDAFLFV